jgi:hypothetical protein
LDIASFLSTAGESVVRLALADRSIGSATLYLIFAPPPPERAERGGLLSKEEHPNSITLFTSLFHGGAL